MRAHPRAHWFVLICCLFLFRLHTPHISAEPREAYQLSFIIMVTAKVVNDFMSNVVNITTIIEVVYQKKCCKIYNGYPTKKNACGAGEETLTLDLFLGKEAL